MSKHNKNIFTAMYPSVDLHGETSATMVAVLNEFIADNVKLQNRKIAIIHGIGEGILKRTTHEMLKHDKRIKTYYLEMCNPGCTIAEINLDNS